MPNTFNIPDGKILKPEANNAHIEFMVSGTQSIDVHGDLAKLGNTPAYISTWRTTATSETIILNLPSTGNNLTIDWGDGSANESWLGVDPSHVYAIAGDYMISVRGIAGDLAMVVSEKDKLISVTQLGDLGWTSFYFAFQGATLLSSFTVGIDSVTNQVTDMESMMNYWPAMISPPDLVGLDTSSVTTMQRMMFNWGNMTTPPDLSGFDTSNVTTMSNMMYKWGNITTPPDLSGFDTSKVTDMDYMIGYWSSMTTAPDLSGFDTSKVTRMNYMAHDLGFANGLILDGSGVDTFNIESLEQATGMFSNATISQADYDSLLTNWGNSLNIIPNSPFNGGISVYTSGGTGEAGRNILTDATNNWTITDGGGV